MNWNVYLRGISVVARKDMRIYYRKAPVFIFGLILPTFLFLAFFVGRELDINKYFPGFLAMSLFFTSSSVGPLIVPWEKQQGTFERLLTYPLSISSIVLGDCIAGAVFGLLISVIVGTFGILLIPITVTDIALIILAFALGNLCFSGLGVLLSSPGGKAPANIMMLAALVRFPLIFVSGIFIPVSEMTGAARYITYGSPLTYLVDLLNHSMGQDYVFDWWADLLVLTGFTVLFVTVAMSVLRRMSLKGL
ncbi:MAG: ABC transporter permease [Euryarchaeota archaeon]|nr:ABC transporter permease [Euryarchaeota archaeon]